MNGAQVLDFLQKFPFLVGAITGSVPAYLLGLLVSHIRREKRWLGYSVTSRNIIKADHSNINVSYGGKPIRRLDSHVVLARNIGNRPLTLLPVRIETSGQIVNYEVQAPRGEKYSVDPEPADAIVVTPQLLNPGEALEVGLTVADGWSEEVSVIARGEMLQVKKIGSLREVVALLDPLAVGPSPDSLNAAIAKGFLLAARLEQATHAKRLPKIEP